MTVDRRVLMFVWSFAVWTAANGCGGSESTLGSGGTGAVASGGRGAGSGGTIGAGGASVGTGGASATGGSSSTGSGGTLGSAGRAGGGRGGTSAGTGGAAGAVATGGATGACVVTFAPLSAPAFTGLDSGPDVRFRVRAEVRRLPSQTGPVTWSWTVSFYVTPNGPVTRIPTSTITDLGATVSVVEFPIKNAGSYDVLATVDDGVGGTCFLQTIATAAAPPGDSYLFRVTPSSLGPPLPAQEFRFDAPDLLPSPLELRMLPGQTVSLAPKTQSGVFVASYLRVSGVSSGTPGTFSNAASSALAVEGNTARGPFDVLFLAAPIIYDVLVVPDGDMAPLLLTGTWGQVAAPVLDKGTPVTGTVLDGAGAPLADVRVVLRSGVRPSTIGVSDASGKFSLWTRGGELSAVFIPPTVAGLPEVHVAAGPGISLDSKTTSLDLRMTWAAPTTGAFSVTVKVPEGTAAAPGTRVRVESVEELTTGVGTVEARVVPAPMTPRTPPLASGLLRIELTVDAAGVARFPRLPVGRYKMTLVPPGSLTGAALTPVDVILSAAGYSGVVPLARHVSLSGKLLPATGTKGVRIIARDQSTGIVAEVASAVVADGGAYTLPVHPGRTYQLRAEPPSALALARGVLGTVAVKATDAVAPLFTVPAATAIDGTVDWDTAVGQQRLADALVQVFCAGGASCPDPKTPIAEAVTSASGTFRVLLPAPRNP